MHAYVEIGGERYELAQPASYDYDESRLAKQLSSGMSLAALERGLADSDPDAWFAVAFLSMRRVNLRVTQQEVIAALRKQPLLAVVESVDVVEDEQEAGEEPRPPAPTAPPSGLPGNDAGFGVS